MPDSILWVANDLPKARKALREFRQPYEFREKKSRTTVDFLMEFVGRGDLARGVWYSTSNVSAIIGLGTKHCSSILRCAEEKGLVEKRLSLNTKFAKWRFPTDVA